MEYCLGTVQFGMDYGIHGGNEPEYEAVIQILNTAWKNGIRVLDTASVYGDSEQRIGNYINAVSEPGEVFKIISKISPLALRGTEKKLWKDIVLYNARESLNKLQITKMQGYLFHDASFIHDINVVKALYAAVEEGYADTIGVSVYLPEEALEALDNDMIGIIQIPYNTMDRRLDKAGFFERVKKCNRSIKIFARSPLLQGFLTMEPEHLPPHMIFAKPYLLRYRKMCKEFGKSPFEVAVGYVLAHKEIDYLLFGVDDEKQLKDYLDIKEMILPEELKKRLEKEFETVEDRLVNPTLWES